jgi:hypothetical protein
VLDTRADLHTGQAVGAGDIIDSGLHLIESEVVCKRLLQRSAIIFSAESSKKSSLGC